MAKRGRPPKFRFLIRRLKAEVNYAPATIADFITQADVQRFNQSEKKQLTLLQWHLRARTTLAAYRRRHITVNPTGMAKIRGANLPVWSGKIWKSAFGFDQVKNLHGGSSCTQP